MCRQYHLQVGIVSIAPFLTDCGDRGETRGPASENLAFSVALTQEQQEMIQQLEGLGYLAAADNPPEPLGLTPAVT